MDFVAATRKAFAENRWMKNLNYDSGFDVVYKPTIYGAGFIVYAKGTDKAGPRWQPGAEDVLSDKWVVVDFPTDWPLSEGMLY
ncbi:MAG: hypothetical protein FWF44_03695 [Defluviitaleaceae bacterium]|nr:hypothetical protein [Defluviitaleaceae bacterium]